MKKILKTHLYTVIQFNDERNRNVVHFVVRYRANEPLIDRLRKAIRSFIASDAGIRIKEKNNGDFNWGDAMASIPAAHWKKYDILGIDLPDERGITVISNMVVDHDEDFEVTR